MDEASWRRPEGHRWWPVMVVCTLLCAAAGWLDLKTAESWSVLPVYLAPVALAGWRAGLGAGLIVTHLATLVWFVANYYDPRRIQPEEVILWNMVTRYIAFSLVMFLTAKLRQAIATAEGARSRDPLTGIENRWSFVRRAAVALERTRVAGKPAALVVFDIDSLRDINSRYGMQRGDLVITQLAQAIWESAARKDLVARIDGDSLAILMPGRDGVAAAGVIDHVRSGVQNVAKEAGCPVSVRAALSVLSPTDTMRLDGMLTSAEQALRRAGPGTLVRVDSAGAGSPVNAAGVSPSPALAR